MAADLEEQKKLVLPYLQRAEEIQAVDPRVAYYCRLFAVDQGLKLPKRHKDIDGLLHATLVRLEKDKAQLGGLDKAADVSHCMGFALNIFRRADKKDRAGQSDANTAKAFYAASIFLDILNQFAPLEEPLFEKQRYAVWRAAEIRKAIREGRPPAPPPRDEEADALMAAGTGADGGLSTGSSSGLPGGASEDMGPGLPAPPGAPGAGMPDHLPSAPHHTSSALSASDLTLPSLPDLPPLPPGDSDVAGGPGDSRDSDFMDLPAPPTGVTRGNSLTAQGGPDAPHGAAVAASSGPRFRPGSRVLMGGGAGMPPIEGTVGMVISGGPDPVYKVALRDQLVDVPDSKLAPNLVAGKRVTFVAAAGQAGVGAVVLAAPVGTWPPSYLIRCDDGHELAAPSGNLTMTGEGGQAPRSPQQASPRVSDGGGAPSTSAPGGGYPSLGGGPGAYPSPYGFSSSAGFMGSAPTAPPPSHPSAPHTQYPSPNAPPPPSAPGSSSQYPQHPGPHSAPSTPPAPAAAPAAPAAASHYAASASAPSSAPAAAAPQLPEAVPGFQPSLMAIQEAQKCAKYAVSSLSFDDISGAVQYLTDSLRLLTQPSAAPAAAGAHKSVAGKPGRR